MSKVIFNSKRQFIIRRNDLDKEEVIIDKLRTYLIPKATIGVLAYDNIFNLIKSTFSKYFINSTSKLVRCKVLLKDIEDTDTQEQLITDYHNKSVHRGINETVSHLKRNISFLK